MLVSPSPTSSSNCIALRLQALLLSLWQWCSSAKADQDNVLLAAFCTDHLVTAQVSALSTISWIGKKNALRETYCSLFVMKSLFGHSREIQTLGNLYWIALFKTFAQSSWFSQMCVWRLDAQLGKALCTARGGKAKGDSQREKRDYVGNFPNCTRRQGQGETNAIKSTLSS